MSTKNLSAALRAAAAPVAVAVVAVFGPGVAHADAVAQAYLYLSNITIAPAGGISNVTGTDSGDVSASINGGAPATATANPALFQGFNLQQAVGPNAGSYAPGVAILGAPTGTYVGSSAVINDGNPFFGTAAASTDDTVSLKPSGIGTSFSNTGLLASYDFGVASGTKLTFSFNAAAFLRAFLDPAGVLGSSARASNSWSLTLALLGGTGNVFSWTPDGGSGGITGGTENFDPFSINTNVAATANFFSDTTGVQNGFFSATSNDLAAGTYRVSIAHISTADATILAVPEPTALSLVGLALLGAGVASRRRHLLAK